MAVYKRGETYWFTFVFDGRRIQKSTKQGNRKAAFDIERAYRTMLAKGEVGIEPRKKERRTVADLLDAVEQMFKDEGKLSEQNRSLVKRAKEDFGTKLAGDLNGEDLDKYIARRKAEGAKNATINRVLEIVRRGYTLANKKARKAKAPLPFPEIPLFEKLSEKDNVRKGFFSEAELDALISHLPADLQDFARFAAACGMRKGELSKLTWRMVDADELRIPGEICKNDEDRVLPLTGEMLEIIERRRAALPREKNGAVQMSEFVFHRDGLAVKELRKSWQTAAIAAGLGMMICPKCGVSGPEKRCTKCKAARKYDGKLFHDLRRTSVRNMVRAGVNTQVAKEWSGHKSDSMFKRYSILTRNDLREAAKKTEEYRKNQREKVVAIAK